MAARSVITLLNRFAQDSKFVIDFVGNGSREGVGLGQRFDFVVGKAKIPAIKLIWRIPVGINRAKACRVFGSSLIGEHFRYETQVRASCILVQQLKCCLFLGRSYHRTTILSQICQKDSQLLSSRVTGN
jgi:hypothetical protein